MLMSCFDAQLYLSRSVFYFSLEKIIVLNFVFLWSTIYIMLILKSEKYCKFIISSLFWLYNDNLWDYTDIVRISNHFLCTLHAWICSIFTILFVIFINWRILLSHMYLWFLNDFVWFYNPFYVVFNVWNKYKNKFTEIFLHFY